ncbi:MAG: hypothetical protein IMF17_07310 [Proteobacteria bacterium]|nr:hypothetical protein [Pseudomonadota bacterium]
MTMIVGGALVLLLSGFILRLSYTIMINLINGRKFHHSLEQEFDRLRLGRMLTALGINKTAYIYQTNTNDIHKQMDSCSACSNTEVCDEKLATPEIDIADIEFCNNEEALKEIKQQQES